MNKTIIEYTVAEESSCDDLCDTINKMMASDTWQPLGGHKCIMFDAGECWSQTMVRYSRE